MAVARVHPVHHHMATNSLIKPISFGCESAKYRVLPPIFTVAICYYYSAFTVQWRMKHGIILYATVKVCTPCPRLYMTLAVVMNTAACSLLWTWVLSHHGQACSTKPLQSSSTKFCQQASNISWLLDSEVINCTVVVYKKSICCQV